VGYKDVFKDYWLNILQILLSCPPLYFCLHVRNGN